MSRSRKQKKKFDGCGHQGYGEYCHYCKQQRDGYDFKKDRGKTGREAEEEARIQAELSAAQSEAEAQAKAEEEQRAEEDKYRASDFAEDRGW